MQVLGIEVDAGLVRRWAGWLAPDRQPFFLTADEVVDLGLTSDPSDREVALAPGEGGFAWLDLSAEHRDTYQVWNLPTDLDVVWLDERTFYALPLHLRASVVRAQVEHRRGAVPAVSAWTDILDPPMLRDQADGEHFVWWPTLIEPCTDAVLERVVTDDQLPCRRLSVPDAIWRTAESTLPHARALSGAFARGRANCFGTVMWASGAEGAADVWIVRDTFEAWLTATCTEGGTDDHPGTVLVWRDADHVSTHAAVTLGGGWALHKPGQDWICPRQVVTVHDLIGPDYPGVTLHRYSLPGRSSTTRLDIRVAR